MHLLQCSRPGGLTILSRCAAKVPFPAAAKPRLLTGLLRVPSPSTLLLKVSRRTRATTNTAKLAGTDGSPNFSKPMAACRIAHMFLYLMLTWRDDTVKCKVSFCHAGPTFPKVELTNTNIPVATKSASTFSMSPFVTFFDGALLTCLVFCLFVVAVAI